MKKRLIAVLSAVLVCTVISACQNNTDVNKNTEGADSALFTEGQTDLPGDPSNTELPDVSGEPTAPVYSEGLSYDIYEGNVCRVSGIGTFTGKDLVIPSTYKGNKVVGIQAGAFANCTAIETVVVSEGIDTIDAGAFSGCSSLKSAVFPDSAVNVYNAIFKNCTSLESVVLPKTITTLPDSMFLGCTSLKSFIIPDHITVISSHVFKDCTSLESVVIPKSVTNLPSSKVPFENCTSLATVTLYTEAQIGSYFFGPLTSIKEFIVNEDNAVYKSVGKDLYTKDGKKLIKYASGKEEEAFTIPEGVECIDGYAVYKAESLKNVTFASTVKEIGSYAFYGCTGLTEITIPEACSTIGEEAFGGCVSIKTAKINGVITINARAFKDCIALESVDLPKKIMSIQGGGFSGCTGLKDVNYPGKISEWQSVVTRSDSSWKSGLGGQAVVIHCTNGNYTVNADGSVSSELF